MAILAAQTVLLALLAATALGEQASFNSSDNKWATFDHPISRVAVIGAGPAGLMAATQLLEANFTVRLFERAPSPGGNWLYSPDLPMRESYPNATLVDLPPPPTNLPATIYHEHGDGGLPLANRWRMHWKPRPVWYDLHTNTPAATTSLPGVHYPPDLWAVSVHDVQRHVRAYASMHALNVNDHPIPSSSEPVTSYATAVESVTKCDESSTWKLTLRRLEWVHESSKIREDFWTEEFDAVVVAVGDYSIPHVPAIPGIGGWSTAMEDGQYSVHHAQAYRNSAHYANKTVLIVGASVSATQIAQAIAPITRRLLVSVKAPETRSGTIGNDLIDFFPDEAELVPEISSFETLKQNSGGIREGIIHLLNGSSISSVDIVVLATGYRRNTFLPELVDQKLSNLYWTGHYIHDPTLAYMNAHPWSHGNFQSTAFARVWAGKARLPSHDQMWQDYQERKYDFGVWGGFLEQEAMARQYVGWLNSEALELGGKFIELPPVENREIVSYWAVAKWPKNWFIEHDEYTRFDDLPAREWPRPGRGPPAAPRAMMFSW